MPKNRGQELEAKGDACLKTGLFNWSKDNAGAATNYDQAVKFYTDNNMYQDAINVYKKLISVNQELKDHWATARNYEGIMSCYQKQGLTNIQPYLELIDRMGPLYKLSDAVMSFINTIKEFALHWTEKGDREGAKAIYRALFKQLPGAEDETGRPEAVFGYVALLINDKQYLEAIKFLMSENEIMERVDPESTKRQIYAVDCVLLSVLMDDINLAERHLGKYAKELPGFQTGRDIVFCQKVIDAYKSKNSELMDKAMSGTIAGYVFPASIISLLRKVKFPALVQAPVFKAPVQTPVPQPQVMQEEKPPVKTQVADLMDLETPQEDFQANPGAETQQKPSKMVPEAPQPKAPVEDNPYL